MKDVVSQITGADFKNMFSFYMQTFLKFVLFALFLGPLTTFAQDVPDTPEVEEAPLVPISGLSPDQSVSVAEAQLAAERFALNGFSVSAIAGSQSYNMTISPYYNGVGGPSLTSNTADIQSAGVMGRYGIIPTGSLGSEFSLSMSTSINHSTLGYSQMVITHFQSNLGWGFITSGKMRYYVLGGIGYQVVRGREIENILASGGSTAQIGGGFVLASNLNIEGFVGIARHKVSGNYLNRLVEIGGTASKVTFDDTQTYVQGTLISGRLIYQF